MTPPPVPTGTPWQAWTRTAAVAFSGGDGRAFPTSALERRRQALSPDRRALQELMRLQQTPNLTLNTSGYHAPLSDVVRRYLAERYSLPAMWQTTAEFLATVDATGRLSAEQQTLVRDILERCDLAKFAPVGASPEECRETTALAQAFVEQTAAANLSGFSALIA